MDSIEMQPVGVVRGGRTEAIDDEWGGSEATVALDPDRFSPDVVADSRRSHTSTSSTCSISSNETT